MRKNHIFLIGFMGSGKSTVAKYLSSAYQMKQIEMDEQIEKNEGRSISSIFEKEGEEIFSHIGNRAFKKSGSPGDFCCIMRRRRSSKRGECAGNEGKGKNHSSFCSA